MGGAIDGCGMEQFETLVGVGGDGLGEGQGLGGGEGLITKGHGFSGILFEIYLLH